jgi:hypothetical protein
MKNKEFGEKIRRDFPNTPAVGTVLSIGPKQDYDGTWSIGWKGWAHRGKWGDYAIFDGEIPEDGEYLRGIVDGVRQMGITFIRGQIKLEDMEDEDASPG